MANPRRSGSIAPVVAAALALLAFAPGCAAWRGARLYQSGTEALERGETLRALDELSRAAELVPQASEVQNHLGLAWLEAGDEAAALRSFERAVELDCDNRAASDNLARLEAQMERARRAAALERISVPVDLEGDEQRRSP